MVWPAVIGAAGAIGGALLGNKEAKNTRKSNERIAERDYELQREQMAIQQALAERMLSMQTAPVTDARGNRTEYIPGVGWTTTPSSRTSDLMKASDNEQLQQLLVDAARARSEGQSNAKRRGEEGALADEMRTRLQVGPEHSQEGILAALLQTRLSGVNEQFGRNRSDIMRQMMRQGNEASAAPIMSRLAQDQATQISDAKAQSYLDSINASQGIEAGHNNTYGSLYNTLASRAAGVPHTQFNPVGDVNPMSAGQATLPQMQGVLGAFSPNNVPTGQMFNPDFSNALMVGSLGDSLSGLAAAYQQRNNTAAVDTNRGAPTRTEKAPNTGGMNNVW